MTTQTARKQMPEALLAAIKRFMDDQDVDRVDVRRSGLEEEPEDDALTFRHVMSDNELPQSSSLNSGAFITATVPQADA
ncbi:hypothetical protein QUG92_15790 [Curtobacterium sp. RHCKG23]|uniref:Uncharacterized protein n=1 Tax=Curtobacterium citri TaxID=3055139 RepID=A0ABT7TAH9_9MICO|nr:hypothetical protein [Curtobacterium citri]MDM7886573.1 hypothetical protein [Curtobacterium citri]